MLNFPRFCSQGQVDAYHFPQEENPNFIITKEFSEEDSEGVSSIFISRESASRLLATSISEFEYDDNIYTTTPQNDAEGWEDEVVHRHNPERWVDYSESEDVEIFTSPQSVDESFSPEPLELSTINECDEEVDDDHQDKQPVKAHSPEPRQLSPLYQSPEFDDGERDGEPLKADSIEPQQLSTLHQSCPAEFDDGQQDDESIDSDSPKPRRLFPFYPPEFEPHRRSAQQIETFYPGPQRRFLTPSSILKLDAFEEWFVYMSELGSVDAAALSPEPQRLFPIHQFHSTVYDLPQLAPERGTGIFCPKPTRQYSTHKVILQPELFEDWYVDMSEPILVDEAIISAERHLETARREGQKIFQSPTNLIGQNLTITRRMIISHLRLIPLDNTFQFINSTHHYTAPPHAVSELDDDEASESMEYIPLESSNLEF